MRLSFSRSASIVNTAWLTDTESGLGLSVMVIVNDWRIYLPLVQK